MGAMELATGMPPGMELVKPDQMMSQSTDDGNNEEESSPSPNLHIPHGPSPEPKIEDSECHRSQSAMYIITDSLKIFTCNFFLPNLVFNVKYLNLDF